jgi:hypothetical protein
MTTVEGTINGFPFRATLEPDGQKSHWLKVSRKLREAAGADVGDVVTLELASTEDEPEPRVPADLRRALGRPAGEGGVVGHHTGCAQRLDPLGHLREAATDACAADRQCLRHARFREATRLLLRPVRVLW